MGFRIYFSGEVERQRRARNGDDAQPFFRANTVDRVSAWSTRAWSNGCRHPAAS